ncbi:hypothetical protein D9M70_427790 [compost metagenome]
MGAHPLVAFRLVAAGIADDLQELVGAVAVDRPEDIGLLAERLGENLDQADAEPGDGVYVGEDRRLQLGQGLRELVGADQPLPRRILRLDLKALALGAEIDLFAPVLGAAGIFEPGAIVAAEMRRLAHLDCQLVILRQCEETPRKRKDTVDLFLRNPVAFEIEEAHRAGNAAQFIERRRPLGVARRKARKVEDG